MEKKNSYTVISPLAIDLGAKNTGVALSQGKSNDPPHRYEKQGVNFVFPDTGLNLSQKDRLAKRHQRRGFKRRRLSKRLLQLILRQNFRGLETEFDASFQRLRTFLNRRGYTYLTLEEAQSIADEIKALDLDSRLAIVVMLGKTCGLDASNNFLEQLKRTDKKSLDFYRNILHCCEEALNKKGKIPSKEDNKNLKTIKKSIRSIQEYCANVLKSEEEGHKTRSEYLRNIAHDLSQPEFADLCRAFNLKSDSLARLVGNIANLQLRVLRRYFNDSKMATGDYWEPERLQRVFIRYLKSWHVKKSDSEYQNREKVLAYLEKHGIYKTLTEINPEWTVPPFEDQNNRRPLKCTSLHLNETKLDAEYPKWREWTRKLAEAKLHTYELGDSASKQEVCWIADYYKRTAPSTGHRLMKSADAIILQRLLDRSKNIDDYNLRKIVQVEDMNARKELIDKSSRQAHESGRKEIEDAIGAQAAKHFIDLAGRYYDETKRAKRGLWLPEEQKNLLFRCDRKPRQKKNVRDELIGHIIGADLKPAEMWAKWEKAYNETKTINGRSSVASVCKSIEERRKDIGEEFHHYWHRIKSKNLKPNAGDKIEKDFLKIVEDTAKVANFIAEVMGHDEEQRKRYDNPYSLGQIYNIMDGDISGFHKTCPACTRDNFWRSSMAAVDSKTARASRLSADTMRPFDGFVARYLDRLGEKIARAKWQQISRLDAQETVLVPILLEQNRFRFNYDLAEIKRAARRRQAEEKLKATEKRETDRWMRIRNAGHGICPYTGERIGTRGEYDHILPRSHSKSHYGSVINSEMNLIYASAAGNRQKGDKLYTLKDLDPKYLKAVYHTTDIASIEKQIRNTIKEFTANNNQIYYHLLSPKEQRDFRHALFLSDDKLRRDTAKLLLTQYKMRVSGMQGYLSRVIYTKMREFNREENRSIDFEVYVYDAGDPSLNAWRQNLSAHNAAYVKQKDSQQSPGSHIIDATMLWAQALERGDIPGLPKGLILEDDALEELLPDNVQIVSLESRKQYRRKRPQSQQIFKDTVYAERYLALILGSKQYGFGFDLKNMVKFDREHLPWIFELLKPFVVFRGAPIVKPLDYYLNLLNDEKRDSKNPKGLAAVAKKYIYFNIVREKAAEFQQKYAHLDTPTQTESNQVALLQALRYFTLKEAIFTAMKDAQGGAVSFVGDDTDNKNFTKKVDFTIQDGQKQLKIRAGKVTLPHIHAWIRLERDKTVKKFIKDNERWDRLEASERRGIYDRHFPKTVAQNLRHHSVRKVYSLPIAIEQFGGFRIERKRVVRQFHVQAIQGAKFSGFAARIREDGTSSSVPEVDFSSPTLMPHFTRSRSLAPTEGNAGKPCTTAVFMDEWREIPLAGFDKNWQGVEKFWLQLHSEPRMRVRLQLKNSVIASDSAAWHLVAPFSISKTKKSEDKVIAGVQAQLIPLLRRIGLEPRDRINLVSADRQSTTYEFIVQSTNSKMKAWYNIGK